MDILIVSEYFPPTTDCEIRGGVEARAFYLACELAARNRVTVLASREAGQPEEHLVGPIRVRRCGTPRPYGQGGMILERISFVQAATKAVADLHADIVDGYNFLAYLAALRISKAKRIARLATYHDVWLGEWIRNVGIGSGIIGEISERYVLAQRWDGMIANSEATRQKLLAAGIRSPFVEVVYNGIAFNDFAALAESKFTEPTICYVGRLVRYKRVDDLLHAVAALRQKLPEVRLKIVGSGPEEASLRALSASLGLDRHVEFRGFMPRHRDVMQTVARSHLLCLPSAVEGFGMAVIEAMACGTPVVASGLVPIREITRNGKGSMLFDCGNIGNLTEKLAQILSDDALRNRLAKEAKDLAAAYDWPALAAKVDGIYHRALSQPATS